MGDARAKTQLRKHVQHALQNWHLPSRRGIDPFLALATCRKRGLHRRLRLVDTRLTLNVILRGYIQELGQLQPAIRKVLLRRFVELAPTKSAALATLLHRLLDH